MQSYTKFKEIDIVPRLPLRGNLDITYRCNNNCLHCWLRVPPGGPERQSELSTDEIKIIVDEARKLGCREWAISGGEPMLRPDFPEIFDYITRKSGSYSINTNGTFITPEIAELMKRKGRKMIALYGATSEVHDHVTRNPGSFQATMRGFELLQEAEAEFIVQLIPMKDNYHQFKEMVKLAKSLSSRWRIGAAWLFLSAEGDPKRNEEIKLQRLDPREVIELDKPQLSYEESEQEDFSCPSQDDSLFASCIYHRRDFHIDPYGNMGFCSFIKDPSLRYDLRKGSFMECWEIFIPALKDKVKGGQEYRDNCGSCDLKNECRWCPVYSYLEHRRFSAPVEYLCQVARENRKFKDEWERNHCSYFKCADITIKMESDLPITEETFHPTLNLFQTDEPSQNMIIIQHHFEIPSLNGKDLGDVVYQRGNWEVRRKESSCIYVSSSRDNEKAKKIAVFNKEHTNVRIYSNEITRMENGDFTSFDIDDIFFSQISLAHTLANQGGFFLHSSGVIIGNRGVLFVGHSGAGKSTIRNMALLNENIKPLCNDRNIVRKWSGGYKAFGTWAYSDNLHDVQAVSVPLGAIMFLEQAKENLIIPLEDIFEVTKKLLTCVIRPVESTEWWNKTLKIVGEVAREVPCYRLRFDLTGGIIEQLEDLLHRS
ncbi:MAG: radical SAM protein [Methanosarcina sp.]